MVAFESQSVICFGDSKQASLLFDNVLPITLSEIVPASHCRFGVRDLSVENKIKAGDVLSSLLGKDKKEIYTMLSQTLQTLYAIYESKAIKKTFPEYLAEYYLEDKEILSGVPIRDYIVPFLKTTGFRHKPIILEGGMIPNTGSPEDKCIAIYNVPIIDTGLAKWEQIIEIRKDENRAKKLRNLHLFFFENYASKPISYIEDKLDKDIEDFKNSCRFHGIRVITGTIEMLFSTKNVSTTGLASVAGSQLGGAVGAFIAGSIVQIGQIAIEMRERIYKYKKVKDEHPLSYLIEVKTRV